MNRKTAHFFLRLEKVENDQNQRFLIGYGTSFGKSRKLIKINAKKRELLQKKSTFAKKEHFCEIHSLSYMITFCIYTRTNGNCLIINKSEEHLGSDIIWNRIWVMEKK